MKRQILSLSLVIVGMSLLAVYYLWPPTPQGNWNDDQAAELQQAQVKYHALAHSHLHSSSADDAKRREAELAAAKADWETRQAGLKVVTSAAESRTRFLFWAGIVITVVGVGTFRPIRDEDQ